MRWAIATLLCLFAVPATAAMTTDIGVLTCTLAEHGEKGTEPDSQTRAMLCTFKPKGTGPEESYTGNEEGRLAGGAVRHARPYLGRHGSLRPET